MRALSYIGILAVLAAFAQLGIWAEAYWRLLP